MTFQIGDDVFESGCEMLEASRLHRPDTDWRVTDAHGHEHRWYANGRPADRYVATDQYDTRTLQWIKDGVRFDEDGEPHDVGHLECRACGEHIEPGYTSDTTVQYVPGVRWFRINGASVSQEDFFSRLPADFRP